MATKPKGVPMPRKGGTKPKTSAKKVYKPKAPAVVYNQTNPLVLYTSRKEDNAEMIHVMGANPRGRMQNAKFVTGPAGLTALPPMPLNKALCLRRDHYKPNNDKKGKAEGINVFVSTWYKSGDEMIILKTLRDSGELERIIAAL